MEDLFNFVELSVYSSAVYGDPSSAAANASTSMFETSASFSFPPGLPLQRTLLSVPVSDAANATLENTPNSM